MKITNENISKFRAYLAGEEKSIATIKKYSRDITQFMNWLNGRELSKELITQYKDFLRVGYAPTSVNSTIASMNSFFEFSELPELKVKIIRLQRRMYTHESKELTKQEFIRLLSAAKKDGDTRLYLVLQTLYATGIRVSELKFITMEALEKGTAVIECKGKLREIFIPNYMCGSLKQYGKSVNISSGSIFLSSLGNPLDRSNIGRAMKELAEKAGVSKEKVFPHNIRHLFARTYYSAYKDISRLADILGHSSIETTRLYTMESGDIHRRQLEALQITV
jgi:site-specific recombinase XerD